MIPSPEPPWVLARSKWDWWPIMGLVGLELCQETPEIIDFTAPECIRMTGSYLLASYIPVGGLVSAGNIRQVRLPGAVMTEMRGPDPRGPVFTLHRGEDNWVRLQREINQAALRVAQRWAE